MAGDEDGRGHTIFPNDGTFRNLTNRKGRSGEKKAPYLRGFKKRATTVCLPCVYVHKRWARIRDGRLISYMQHGKRKQVETQLLKGAGKDSGAGIGHW